MNTGPGRQATETGGKASFHDMSIVPSTHSSPKQIKGGVTQQPGTSKPAKLPSFEVLKTDSKIQAEVARRLPDYQDASRIEGKPTSLKSGRSRASVSKIKVHVNWPQDMCTVQPGRFNTGTVGTRRTIVYS